jgi:hypothetical protein
MLRPLKILSLVLALVAASIFLINCGGSSSAKVRIVQAIPDVSPNSVDIYLDGNKVASSVGFEGTYPATGYQGTSAGSRHLQVFPGGQTTGAIFDGNISLNSGSEYTVVLTGFSVGPNVGVTASLFTDTNTAPTSGNVSVRVIHAAPTWKYSYYGSMDVWIVGPPYAIGGTTATIPSLGYTSASSYISAPAGTYEVIATPPGLPVGILVGGPFSFSSGVIRTVIFVDAPGGGLAGTPLVLNDLGS